MVYLFYLILIIAGGAGGVIFYPEEPLAPWLGMILCLVGSLWLRVYEDNK